MLNHFARGHAVEKTLKRLQDVQSCIKKKEAFRKKKAGMTGGGPLHRSLLKPGL